MVMVAVGLGLLIAALVPPILGCIIWVRRDLEVLFIQAVPVGPKLWIMSRMLQMSGPIQVHLANFLGLMLHVLGVIALSWRVRNQTAAMRWMGMILRGLVVIGMMYWLALACRASAGKMNSNDIKSPILVGVAVLDIACIVLSGLIIAGIARRGGYTRISKWSMLLMIAQAGGLSLLYAGIYMSNEVEPVLRPSLGLHAAGGSGLTIISIWLMFKLAGAARAVRMGMLDSD
jgi:hypothetical protein